MGRKLPFNRSLTDRFNYCSNEISQYNLLSLVTHANAVFYFLRKDFFQSLNLVCDLLYIYSMSKFYLQLKISLKLFKTTSHADMTPNC